MLPRADDNREKPGPFPVGPGFSWRSAGSSERGVDDLEMNLDVASLDDAAVVVSDPGAGKRHTYGVTSDRGGLTAVGDADYEFALSARLRLPTPMRSSCINTPQ